MTDHRSTSSLSSIILITFPRPLLPFSLSFALDFFFFFLLSSFCPLSHSAFSLLHLLKSLSPLPYPFLKYIQIATSTLTSKSQHKPCSQFSQQTTLVPSKASTRSMTIQRIRISRWNWLGLVHRVGISSRWFRWHSKRYVIFQWIKYLCLIMQEEGKEHVPRSGAFCRSSFSKVASSRKMDHFVVWKVKNILVCIGQPY